METKLLEKLGMTAKEIRAYLKLLELGECSANILAKRIEENRTSTYSLLQSMQKKGLISFINKHGIKYFIPADPTRLINQYFEGAKALQKTLPELLAIYNKFGKEKPKITFYEGLNGIIQIAETLLECPNSMRESFMGIDPKTIHPEMKDYIENDFINRRVALGIKYRGIVTGYVPMGSKYKATEKDQLRELKYVDPKLFPIKIHIDIFPHNKVALYSYNKDEMMGVVIEHEAFFLTMKTVFKLAWLGVPSL